MKYKWTNKYHYYVDHYTLTIAKNKLLADGKTEIIDKQWVVILDPDDVQLDMIQLRHWRVDKDGYPACWYIRGDNRYTALHRYIMGVSPEQYVRNISHDLLDLRKSNLSICGSLSCVISNNYRAVRGYKVWPSNGLFNVVKIFPTFLLSIYNSKRRSKCVELCKKLRDGEVDSLQVAIESAIAGRIKCKNHNKNNHLHRYANGFYRVAWEGKYVGGSMKKSKAIAIRNEAIKKWFKKLWKENLSFKVGEQYG